MSQSHQLLPRHLFSPYTYAAFKWWKGWGWPFPVPFILFWCLVFIITSINMSSFCDSTVEAALYSSVLTQHQKSRMTFNSKHIGNQLIQAAGWGQAQPVIPDFYGSIMRKINLRRSCAGMHCATVAVLAVYLGGKTWPCLGNNSKAQPFSSVSRSTQPMATIIGLFCFYSVAESWNFLAKREWSNSNKYPPQVSLMKTCTCIKVSICGLFTLKRNSWLWFYAPVHLYRYSIVTFVLVNPHSWT